MFENLIAQPASNLLIDDIAFTRLPPSILFSGQTSSGKLTAALELARILSCHEGTAHWTCACASCRRHKELSHPDVIIMGPRDCILEIRAASEAFLRSRSLASRFLFIRAIKKLVLRFNPVLQDQSDTKFSRVIPLLTEIDERLEELSPARPLPEDFAIVEKTVNMLVIAAEKLEDDFLYDSIPVNQVRNVSSWVRLSPSDKKKILIIENADRMQDAARNAFLKVLEEPPADVVFILTTARRGAIMPTILSRVRTYAFVDRQMESQHEVISRVFHDTPRENELLIGYFNRFLPVTPERIAEAAYDFINIVLLSAIDEGRKPLAGMRTALSVNIPQQQQNGIKSVGTIVASLNKCKPGIVYRLFLSKIAGYMRESLRSGSVDACETFVYTKWTELIRETLDSVDIYNIGAQSALEKMLQGMKDAI